MNELINNIFALSGVTNMVMGVGDIPGQFVFFVDGLEPRKRALLERTLNALCFSLYPVQIKSILELPPGQIPKPGPGVAPEPRAGSILTP
jgi:hypothetical protein